MGNSNDLFTARVRPPVPPCRPHAVPAFVSARRPRAAPWRTPRSGTPWAPRALETIPCHTSTPAAGAALSAAGRPQARSQGTERTDG